MAGTTELLLSGCQSLPLRLFGLGEHLGLLSVGTVPVKSTLGSGENVSVTLGQLFLYSGFHVLCPPLKTKCVGEASQV